MMEQCSGLICTAGFESVCEAMYLGKPIMMVPVPNHIEQEINAWDGQRAGAGISDTEFNLSRFISYLPVHQNISENFKTWQGQTAQIFLKNFEEVTQKEVEIYTFKSGRGSLLAKSFRRALGF